MSKVTVLGFTGITKFCGFNNSVAYVYTANSEVGKSIADYANRN